MRILVINGPNINMLGIREPDIYGKGSYADLCSIIESYAAEKGVEVKLFQSNHEGSIVDEIQAAYGKFDGIVINPAAYTHTSVAGMDKSHRQASSAFAPVTVSPPALKTATICKKANIRSGKARA